MSSNNPLYPSYTPHNLLKIPLKYPSWTSKFLPLTTFFKVWWLIKSLTFNVYPLLRENLVRQQQEFLAAHSMPRELREMLHRSEQHLPPPGPMLPHPGPIMTPRHPVPEHMLRDPRLQHTDPRNIDPRNIDPRLVDPRFSLSSHLQLGGNKQVLNKNEPVL